MTSYSEHFQSYLFLGMGLIGGSIARSIRALQPQARLAAYVRHPEHLLAAIEDGILDEILPSPTVGVEQADVVLLCAPTRGNIANLRVIAPYLGPRTLVTDVGSVKHDIQECAEELGIAAQFLGGHPMTGRESAGYASADPQILVNAYYLLTPTAATRPDFVRDFTALVRGMQALPLTCDPIYHDYATAAISHLPHLIAATLVTQVRDEDDQTQMMKTIAAGGFKDITRIASSDPAMWQSICESNRDNIRTLLSHYIARLQEVDRVLEAQEYGKIGELFRESGSYRSTMSERRTTALSPEYRLYIDIPDETGAIAQVATVLAGHAINIKNIGIVHNREQAEGALCILFDDAVARDGAAPLLKDAGYTVIER